MLWGDPVFDYGELVRFGINDPDEGFYELEGTVEVVDSHGIFGDDTRAYYDIMVDPDPRYGGKGCFYKHIPEEAIERVAE